MNIYQILITLNPNSAGVYNNIGCALQKNLKHTEAVRIFNQTIKLQPQFADLTPVQSWEFV